MNNKKGRGKNFSEQEAIDLLSLVVNYIDILENKQTNAVTNQDKARAWKNITEEFNISHPLTTRTLEQLSAKYENLKHRSRKYAAQKKQALYSTGGGPSQTVIDVVLDTVLSILPSKTVEGEINLLDCDSESLAVFSCTGVEKKLENTDNLITVHVPGEITNEPSEIVCVTMKTSDADTMVQTSGSNCTPAPTPCKMSKKHKRKRDSDDIEKILEAKAKFYETKTKLLEVEYNLKLEEVKNKVLQNQVLEQELSEKQETQSVRFALLKEELEGKRLHNMKLRADL